MGDPGTLCLLAARRLAGEVLPPADRSAADGLLSRLGYRPGEAAGARLDNRLALLRAASSIRDVFEIECPDAPGARLFCATSDPACLDPGFRHAAPASVAGCAPAAGRAFERCVGEAVEYLAQFGRQGLAGDADAVEGLDLVSGRRVAVAAELCVRRGPDFATPAGTGCAAGPTREAATLGALLELVERAAVARWWHGGMPGRRLPVSRQDAALGYLAALRRNRRTRRTGLLDITAHDGLPVVAAFSFGEEGSGFAAGFAAHPDPDKAARGALRELIQMETGLRIAAAKAASGAAPNDADRRRQERAVRVRPDHPALQSKGMAGAVAAPCEAGMLDHAVSLLAQAGIGLLVVELTRPGFAIPVMRVLAEGLSAVPDEQAWADADPARNMALL